MSAPPAPTDATPAAPPPPPPAPAAPPRRRRLLLKTLVALAVLAALALLFRNFLIRKGMETAVTEVTGFPLAVGGFDLGLLDTRVEITDMRLSNPEGFEDPRCLHAPKVLADIEGKSLFGKELHIQEMVLNVREVVVVKNAKGETNLDRLKALGGSGEEEPSEEKPAADADGKRKAGGKGEELKWRCDRLHLKMGRVLFLDYSKAKDGKPKKDEWDLGVNETFKNVTGPDQIVKIIVLKVVSKTPVRLARATAESLKDGLVGVAGAAAEGVKGAVKGVGDALGGLLGGDDEKPEPKKKKER